MLLGFGGVSAVGPSGPIDLGGSKPRSLLALLMVQPGAVVAFDRLVDRMWMGEPPPKAEVSIRGYVSNLRRALSAAGFGASDVISFRDRGYALDLPPDTIDLHLFASLVDGAAQLVRSSSPPELVRSVLVRALDLWSGPPLGSIGEELGLVDVAVGLEERRGQAVELLADARLRLGEHAELPAWLATEISQQPYREGLRERLALALYRSGRAVEALRSLDEARRRLRDDIGVEPGASLRAIEQAILAQDDTTLAWTPDPVALPTLVSVAHPEVDDESRFGRHAEEERIASALHRLPSRGGVVVISGEAGIGKSSLLRHLRVEAARRGLAVGWDRCPESAAGAPYRSWRSATSALTPELELQADVRAPGQEPATALLRTQLNELTRLSTLSMPAVIVIDDLQWADDATLSMLQFLAPQLERLRLLVAVGVRRAGASDLSPAVRDCLAEMMRTIDPVDLRLAPLDRSAITDWVATAAGSAPPAFVDYLVDTTSGNPFFVRELLSLLVSDGQVHADFSPRAAVVPHAVQDVVRRRTSRLPPATQVALTTAAVIGRRFDLDVLAEVLGLEPTDALDQLEPALDDDVIRPDEESPGRFSFSHALVSGTLIAELNAVRLAAHHARILDALEVLHADDDEPWLDELAHHAAEGLLAGTAPRALEYALRAAAVADTAQSSADVIVQLRRAVSASERIHGFPGDRRRDLLLRLGTALRDAGALEGRGLLLAAARLADAQGDHHALASILGNLDNESLWAGYDWNLHDPQVIAALERARAHPLLDERDRATLTMALAGELTYADNERSNSLFAEAEACAEPIDDAVLSARILLRWFWAVSGPSGLERRADIGDRLIALDRSVRLPARLRPLAHLARVSSALESADGDLARRCIATARSLADPVRTPTAWAHLQFAEAGLAILDGELERARAHAAALRPALQRVRRYTADSSPAVILAVIDAEIGRTDVALERLAPMSSSPYAAPIAWLEAWILCTGGRHDDASAALLRFDGPLPDDWLRVPLTTAGLHAAAQIGDVAFIRRHIEDLAPVAGRFVFIGEGGVCLGPTSLALACAHLALGDVERATSCARDALSTCRRMGAALWTPRCERLLERLGSGRPG
ncbi:MAG: BTAD domain-containing putative transcriptional regulator [Ilumatobacteraceae bacterium]